MDKSVDVELSDEKVLGDPRYLVNSSDETIYNSKSGLFDKNVKLYYNPTTRHLVMDRIEVSGGQVNLSAEEIMSTGNRKIVAAGGGMDMKIDVTGTDRDLVVMGIDTSSRGASTIIINGQVQSGKTYQPKEWSSYN